MRRSGVRSSSSPPANLIRCAVSRLAVRIHPSVPNWGPKRGPRMASKIASHLHRSRHGVYYFRRAVPQDLRAFFRLKELYRTLDTTRRGEAVRQSRKLSATVDELFYALRTRTERGNERIHSRTLDGHALHELQEHWFSTSG